MKVSMQRGVFLDVQSVDRGDLDLQRLKSTLVEWRLFEKTSPQQVPERLAGVHVVVANKAPLKAHDLEQARDLRLICIAATGTNNVDLEAAARRNITVCNVRDYATASVVQHVFTLILNLSTRFLAYHQAVADGRWQASEQFCLLDYPIEELAGKTLGIVGYGVLGHAVAEVGRAFGMHVIIADHKGAAPRPGRVAFAEVLRRADVLTLHCPLNAATRNLIGEEELAAMQSNALLINCARGGIVDEAALVQALRQNRIAGAGFDVLSEEPPVRGNVLLDSLWRPLQHSSQHSLQHSLQQQPSLNLIVTPHIAWASRASRQRLLDEIVKNIQAFQAGTPRNQV